MKKLLALSLLFTALILAQPGSNQGDNLPSSCVPGQTWLKTGTTNPGLYYCNATAQWVLVGGSGGSVGVLTYNGRSGTVVSVFGDYSTFYATLSHVHLMSDITGLVPTLASKSDTTHNHTGVYEPVDANILRRNAAVTLTSSFSAYDATSSKPFKGGTTLPETCVTGDTYFKSDASPGSNVYTCISNVWSVISSGEMITPGLGLAKAGTVVSIDPTTTPQFASGSGDPIGACIAGTRYMRISTTPQAEFFCGSNGVWAATGVPYTPLPPTTTVIGSITRNAGATGEFVSGVDVDGHLIYAVPVVSAIGVAGGNPITSFTSQTSVTIAHGLLTKNIGIACYTAAGDAIGSSWSVAQTAPFDATVTFATAQTGYCITLGGTGKYGQAISGATSYTVLGSAHGLGSCDVQAQIWDNATPSKRVEPNSVTCDPSTKNIVVTFATTQAGRLVIQ